MRFSSVAWLLPLLLFGQVAEAATIRFATKDCGTPPLLGLEFEVTGVTLDGVNTVNADTEACPDEAVGSFLDTAETTPLYGTSISSVEFTLSDFALTEGSGIILADGSPIGASLVFMSTGANSGILTATFSTAIVITCPTTTAVALPCTPVDLAIGLTGFATGSTFRVTEINGITVPEPATLTLLAIGLASAAVRRRNVRKEN